MEYSVDAHNSSIEATCDWIEASLLFDPDCEVVTRVDAVDHLVDANIYRKQDKADEFLVLIWKELARRSRRMGRSSSFSIRGNVITRKKTWRQVPAHSFCLSLTMVDLYPKDWAGPLGGSHAVQGELFEKIAEQSFLRQGWTVLRTGWANGQANVKLPEVINAVSAHLLEHDINPSAVEKYKEDNELGLDLVVSVPFFQDDRGGKPTYLVQCASGMNEVDKRKTPDIDIWSKLIAFSSNPVRAFVVPFTYDSTAFYKLCNEVNGMVLDRYRLLSPGQAGRSWLGGDLKARVVGALQAKLKDLDRLRAS